MITAPTKYTFQTDCGGKQNAHFGNQIHESAEQVPMLQTLQFVHVSVHLDVDYTQ